jgi:hypothetical protein
MPSTRIPDAVRRVFTESFTARDVAEPLASFDGGVAAEYVRDFMKDRDFDVVGVRGEGQVVGYVDQASLGDGTCGRYRCPLEQAAVVSDAVPLPAVLMGLNRAPFLFVSAFGQVGGIITPADLEKPAVRMWLFGIVTLIEMRFTDLIERHCPEEVWKDHLSAARLQKAHDLLAERRRRNQTLRLLDCLQFSDKGQIVARNEDIRKLTIFPSRRQAEEATKRVEDLRNNLAHAQQVLSCDWGTIIQLCELVARQ